MQIKLNHLKAAADNSIWSKCIKIATELLEKVRESDCLILPVRYVQEYLPNFEENHSNTRWPRERFNEILKKMEGDEVSGSKFFILPDIDSEFDTPGSNGFIKELEMLWELVFSSDPKSGCSDKAASIIGGIIMARLTNSWGLRHPDEWLHWYRTANQGRDGVIGLAQSDLMKDPLIVELAISEWYKVADQIQILLIN